MTKNLGFSAIWGIEALLGVTSIVGATLSPELKDGAIAFYTLGGALLFDGVADMITGKGCYLIARMADFGYNSGKKSKGRTTD